MTAERKEPYEARRRVAKHAVTWDADGEPLLDGERMYVPSGSDRSEAPS